MPQATVNGDVPEDEATSDNKAPGVGSSRTVMKLWEERSSGDRIVWLTEPPEVKPKEKSISESPEYAITLLHRDVNQTGQHKLHTIIMRGPELQNFLVDTIPNISSFYDETDQGITIRLPFRLLFWYFDQIDAAAESSDQKLSQVTSLLQGVLKDEFRDLLAKRKQLLATQEMNFDTLWTLFKPGLTCVTAYSGHLVAVKVTTIEFKNDPMGLMYYRINYTHLGWDGQYLGWQDFYTDIIEFNGRRKVQDLAIFPIEFHNDANIGKKLSARGRRFVELAIKEPFMMSFNGEALDRQTSPMWWQGDQKKIVSLDRMLKDGCLMANQMSERVVLDARAYNHYYRRLSVSQWMQRDKLNDALKSDQSDDDFIFCCTEYHCFALQHKKWTRIWIDDVDEVVFNETAYPSLVLPSDYKQLLLAFAEAQIDGYGFDDVIAGKGQGILMLLAGPPGTGKTLTAEAMAEHMRRPLYSVAAGELGASGKGGMEAELNRVLELCTRWNAVLLLDEADVFLERRTDNDLERNTIVSMFLRRLEYYRGIMFLTTNRIGSFDEAFKSRIHVAIRYPDLDTKARRVIWENFLKKTRQIYPHGTDISTAQLDEVSLKNLNGREIRNIVKSAQLLASRSKEPLRKSHLDTVWRVEHEDSPW